MAATVETADNVCEGEPGVGVGGTRSTNSSRERRDPLSSKSWGRGDRLTYTQSIVYMYYNQQGTGPTTYL